MAKLKKIDGYRHEKPRESLYLFAFTQGSLTPNPLPFTHKASWRVLKHHKDEKRDDGSDYSSHPLDTCRILLNFGVRNDRPLAGAILHDTIESGKTTKEKLKIEYDAELAEIVDNQTKREGETLEEYYARVASKVESVLGKGADRLSNLGTAVGTYAIPRLKRYSAETKKYILPMIEEARHTSMEYCNALVALRDGLERILKVIDAYIEKAEENEELKKLLEDNNIPISGEIFAGEAEKEALPQATDADKLPVGFTPLTDTVSYE